MIPETGKADRSAMQRRLTARLAALDGWRADLAAALTGGLSALALPPLHAVPALLIGIPTLLCLIQGARRPAVAARRGFWGRLVEYAASACRPTVAFPYLLLLLASLLPLLR